MAITYQIKYKLDEVLIGPYDEEEYELKDIRVAKRKHFGIYEDYNLGKLLYSSIEKSRMPLNSIRILDNLEI